jgi:hypothetical protein
VKEVIPRLAVVPTHNRPQELQRLIAAIAPQCDYMIIIDNASNPPVPRFEVEDWPIGRTGLSHSCWIRVVHDGEQPPNLSRLWNVGIDFATYLHSHAPEFDVAVLNDDAVPPPGWWDAVSGAMRATGAAAGSADPFGHLPAGASRLWGPHAPLAVTTRLTGWAFILRGEVGLRADERLRWWYGDDLLSLRAREAGGVVHVGGVPVENTYADQSTLGALAEQAGRDRATFVEITGRQPW